MNINISSYDIELLLIVNILKKKNKINLYKNSLISNQFVMNDI